MLNRNKIWIGLSSLFILLLISINSIYYVSQEQWVYVWDQKGYCEVFFKLGELFSNNPIAWLITCLLNIREADYNVSPVALLLPFYYLIDHPRLSYILAVTLTYLFSLSFIIAKNFTETDIIKLKGWFLFVLLLSASFVPFWRPTLRGYPDIVGIIPIVLAIFYVVKNDFSNQVMVKKALTLGLLLWLPFLFRRWYIYTVISLYLTLPIFTFLIYSLVDNYEFNKTKLKKVILNFLTAGLFSTGLVLLFQYNLLIKILFTSYKNIYSAYQMPFFDSVSITIKNIGFYILPLFLFGLFTSIYNYKNKTGLLGLFCLFNLVISFLLFTQTQAPDIHHQLPFALWILIISLIGLGQFIALLNNRIKSIFVLLVSIFALYITTTTLYRLPVGWQAADAVLPEKVYSLRLDKLDNYQELVSVIQRLTNDGEKMSVLASSQYLSDSLLASVSSGTVNNRLQVASHVDLRNKLILDVSKTRYVLVADPIQLHLRPDGQRVISIPAQNLLSGTGIGQAYKKLPYDFELENGIHAYIYEKVRPFTLEEAQTFLNEFIAFYPDWQSEYGDGSAARVLAADISSNDKNE